MTFLELASRLAKQEGSPIYGAPFLSFDPGKTTGWAFFEHGELQKSGQLDTRDLETSFQLLDTLLNKYRRVERVIVEDYRVYKWKTDHHAWSELYTSHLIGMIETLCIMNGYVMIKQPAQVAKNFATDKLIKDWGYWVEGERHARDAIRHGCYHVLFGDDKTWHRKRKNNPHNVG